MSSELVPGDKLILRPLAQRLGLSPTPVREALLRLVSEQALALDERGSAIVPVMSAECFEEMIALRGDLESRAIERAVSLARDAQIAELEVINARCMDAYARGDAVDVILQNLAFHRAICVAGRSLLTLHALEGLWLRLGPSYATRIGAPLPRFDDVPHPHVRMLDALHRRDLQAAREAAMADVVASCKYAHPRGG
ncbi:GntR family transcriptional regulator [Acetobacteraceae bacterium KSS8]|uniref:GntR family transcriptional regulator n=2 Tax=Endosaccharibacter trunci TaxID=2812733 RepID=A0ABT1W9N9_9PROT|nr:GntR family transcriptional regulator [Acetobacteraceae bacterium KSS8]